MEPERKTLKIVIKRRRDAGESSSGSANNPFFIQKSTGLVSFDPVKLSQPEYQELLRALYEHYERGAARPLPFNMFPVKQVPQELLLKLVGGDVRTFINLAASDPVMAARLKPLAAQFVCEIWPDVALLLHMACDLELIQQITRLNMAYPLQRHSNLMGFCDQRKGKGRWEWVDADTRFQLQNLCKEAVAHGDVARLNSFLRIPYRISRKLDWELYAPIMEKGDISKLEWSSQRIHFELPPAQNCRFSQIAAIKLYAEVLEAGHQLGMEWRFSKQAGVMYREATEFPEKMGQHLIAGNKGMTNFEAILQFANALCDTLTGSESGEFEFDDIYCDGMIAPMIASHLRTVMKRYEREMALIKETMGVADPLAVELIPTGVLSNQVCLMVGATDCNEFWYKLLKKTWRGLMRERARQYAGDDSSSMDAPYHCTECRSVATRFDVKFNLPFCAQKECMSATFTKLHAHGLYSGVAAT